MPAHGAIWLTLYPNIMVEWYPHVLVVSTLHPRGPRKTLNMVEFYYPEEIAAFEREFVEASRPPTWRPASRTTRSRCAWTPAARALMERGDDEFGPYQSPMEDGMQHFHEWYRREMATALSHRLSRARRLPAPLLMLGASLLFATMGVCVKLASAQYPAGEIVFYRGLVGHAVRVRCCRAARGSSLRTDVPAMHFWRSLCGVIVAGPVVLCASAACRWPPR